LLRFFVHVLAQPHRIVEGDGVPRPVAQLDLDAGEPSLQLGSCSARSSYQSGNTTRHRSS
jgi:hypothetical protein